MKQLKAEYDKWYETYVDEMFSYGMAFGMDKETILDAIHDVFLSLYEKEDQLEVKNVKFYLICSLKNRILTLKRHEVSYLDIVEGDNYEFMIQVDGPELIEEDNERKEYAEQIEYLLGLLTSKQREVIYLRFMQELSYEEIGEILRISTKSVRKLTYRAIERMQEEKMLFLFFMFSKFCN